MTTTEPNPNQLAEARRRLPLIHRLPRATEQYYPWSAIHEDLPVDFSDCLDAGRREGARLRALEEKSLFSWFTPRIIALLILTALVLTGLMALTIHFPWFTPVAAILVPLGAIVSAGIAHAASESNLMKGVNPLPASDLMGPKRS